jgi:hypothetical protein
MDEKIERGMTGFAYRQGGRRRKVQPLCARTKRRFGDPFFRPAKHRDLGPQTGQIPVNFIHLNS